MAVLYNKINISHSFTVKPLQEQNNYLFKFRRHKYELYIENYTKAVRLWFRKVDFIHIENKRELT